MISSKTDWFDLLDAFELWCWQRLLRVPWKATRSKQQRARNRTICQEISKIFCFQLHRLLWYQVLESIMFIRSPQGTVCVLNSQLRLDLLLANYLPVSPQLPWSASCPACCQCPSSLSLLLLLTVIMLLGLPKGLSPNTP